MDPLYTYLLSFALVVALVVWGIYIIVKNERVINKGWALVEPAAVKILEERFGEKVLYKTVFEVGYLNSILDRERFEFWMAFTQNYVMFGAKKEMVCSNEDTIALITERKKVSMKQKKLTIVELTISTMDKKQEEPLKLYTQRRWCKFNELSKYITVKRN